MGDQRVAIITRTRNRPALLPRALQSVLDQDYPLKTWCVVNDGGERAEVDQCVKRGRKSDLEVIVVHRGSSVGMEAASNAGIRACESEFVAIHDDDDSWMPQFLIKTVNFLIENENYSGVVTQTERIEETLVDGLVKTVSRSPFNSRLRAVDLGTIAMRNQFPPISFVFRRSAYEEIGGFDETLPVLGDWDFNLRLLLNGNIGVISEMLAMHHYRVQVGEDDESYSNTESANRDKHERWEAAYRNRKLREDLEKRQVGIGFLLAHGKQTHNLLMELENLRIAGDGWRALDRLANKLGLRRLFRSPRQTLDE